MEAWEWRGMFESLRDGTEEEIAAVRARRLKEWEEEMEEFDRKWGAATGAEGTEETGTKATGTEETGTEARLAPG